MRKRIDIKPGTRFGRLTVIEEVEPYISSKGHPQRKFKLQCDCGTVTEVRIDSLRAGLTTSCGCFNAENHTTHGCKYHPAYNTYCSMMARCYDTKNVEYHLYGGRGIKVCDEWKDHPEVFCAWADVTGHKRGLTIDRIDPDGDYCPDNCRWLTKAEQQRNRRDNRHVIDTLTGKEYSSIIEASEDTGIAQWTIQHHISGDVKKPRFISFQKANTRKRHKLKCYETGEIFNTTGDVARKYNISREHLYAQCKSGGSVFYKKLGLTFSFIGDDTPEESPFVNLLDLAAQPA